MVNMFTWHNIAFISYLVNYDRKKNYLLRI